MTDNQTINILLVVGVLLVIGFIGRKGGAGFS
jgi:hypothetical protein